MTSNIYITPSTTLVLLKNLSTPVVIYLSSLQAPNFFVTIRDTTGQATIRQTPVVISTIGGALFENGTSVYNLDQPYGLVNLGLQNSTIWHFKHTSGQKPATAAATVQTVSTSISYFTVLSSIQKVTSTLIVQDIRNVNPISFTGNATFLAISVASSIVVANTGISYGPVDSFDRIIVRKEATFLSSLLTSYVSTFQQPLYLWSSLSSGGTLYVGGVTNVSSLQLQSTVQVQTLQVTTSTATAFTNGITQVGGLFSTLGSITAQNDLRVQNTVFVGSMLSTQGTLFATNLFVQNSSLFLSTTNVSFASFFSTTTLQSSLLVPSSITAYSTTSIHDSTITGSITTSSLYAFTNFQLQSFAQVSTLLFQSTVSTVYLQVPSSVSVTGYFTSLSSISTLSSISVSDTINIVGNATFQYLSIGKDFLVGGSTFIGSSISTGSGLFSADLTASTLEVKGPATLSGNVYVSAATVVDQLVVAKDTLLYGLHNNPFYFNTLTVTSLVSTPLLSLSSILSTGYTYITNPNYQIITSNIYASTLLTPQISTLSSLTTQVVAGNTFSLLSTPVQIQNPYTFLISSSTYFVQGVSTSVLSTATIKASTIRGALFGDATYVSNITTLVTDNAIFSTFQMSTLSSVNIYTSSFSLQTLRTSTLNFYSSLNTTQFRIDAPGTPILSTVHQIVNTTISNLVINNVLYLNTNSNVLISPIFRGPAQYNLDISGLLYVSSLAYSSIQVLDVNQLSNNSVTGITSSLVVANFLQANNLQMQKGTSTFLIQNTNNITSNAFDSIQAATSSLVIENQVCIQNEVYSNRQLIIDPTQANFATPANSMMTVYGNILTSTLKTSTLTVGGQIYTPNLFFSSFAIYNGNIYSDSIVRNSFQSYNSTLVVNSTLFLHKTYNVLGINTTPDPSTFMRVSSNAFFSTLSATDLRAGSLVYSFLNL